MRERVREQPYMFEQVKQVSGPTEWLFHCESDKFLHSHVFVSVEKRTGSGWADVQEQTEEIRNNGALYPATRGRKWGRVIIFQTECQCRWGRLSLQQVCKRRIFGHVLHVMPQILGKLWIALLMEPRSSCGLLILHYIILCTYATVFSKERQTPQPTQSKM